MRGLQANRGPEKGKKKKPTVYLGHSDKNIHLACNYSITVDLDDTIKYINV